MLIYSHTITPRIEYIFGVIFRDILGLPYRVTMDGREFRDYEQPKVSYGYKRSADEFFIASHELLSETGIHTLPTDFFSWEGLPAFFKTEGDIPFDIFAASFYLVSRYEEYFDYDADEFGRFPAKSSLAWKHGFLHRPIVNLWARELSARLCLKFPGLGVPGRAFQPLMTFDIDVAYAFRGRSFKRNVLGSINDLVNLRRGKLRERLLCLQGRSADPYDSYAYIRRSLERHDIPVIFFFLLAESTNRYDRNLPPSAPELRNLIESLSAYAETAIHPSYYSSEKTNLVSREKELLEIIINRKVTKSRQHYLRFRLPDTFEALEKAGISDDYSLGFAELPGFRASICSPFLFYNLRLEKTSSLTLHSVTCMEGTFIEDMQLGTDEAVSLIKKLIEEVKEVNGEFVAIWHNHTVSDYGIYKGWRSVYEATLDHLSAMPS